MEIDNRPTKEVPSEECDAGVGKPNSAKVVSHWEQRTRDGAMRPGSMYGQQFRHLAGCEDGTGTSCC